MKKALPLVTNPDPRLRKIAQEVALDEIASLAELSQNMIETMFTDDGVGLAAPQIGESIRLITVNSQDGVKIMFNPKITKFSLLKEWGEEGCLSVPNVFGDVKRYKKITCTFIDSDGKKRILQASGLMARVIQHEVDHLDGILFIDKAKNLHTI